LTVVRNLAIVQQPRTDRACEKDTLVRPWRLALLAAFLVLGLLLLVVSLCWPGVRAALRDARPWTSLAACGAVLCTLVVSGSYWYSTDPWNISVERPDGAFALGVFILSLAVTALLIVHLRRLPDILVAKGARAGAIAAVLVDAAKVTLAVAFVSGLVFLALPYLWPPYARRQV
jgi:hypothetical protein